MDDRSELISQKKLKLLAGGLGIALPTLVYLGNLYIFNERELLHSISTYYYTGMRDVFVGALFSIGVFMVAYEGYSPFDRLLSTTGGLLAIGTAVFPTTEPGMMRDNIATLHLLSAAGFFFVLTIFCFIFTKSNPDVPKTKLKMVRNFIYYICGFIIAGSLLLLVTVELQVISFPLDNITFWLEYVGISAFGVAWIVKGEGVFLINDDPIFEMNPWEIVGFVILMLLILGSVLMLYNIFFI